MLPSEALRHQITLAGRPLRIRYYTETIGSVWDDERILSLSGTDIYISGIIQKIDSTKGSEDQVLQEEGRIKFDDSKMFVAGSIDTTSGARIFTISISGLNTVYREITQGAIMPQYYGDNIYKKLYLRFLEGGSLF